MRRIPTHRSTAGIVASTSIHRHADPSPAVTMAVATREASSHEYHCPGVSVPDGSALTRTRGPPCAWESAAFIE